MAKKKTKKNPDDVAREFITALRRLCHKHDIKEFYGEGSSVVIQIGDAFDEYRLRAWFSRGFDSVVLEKVLSLKI